MGPFDELKDILVDIRDSLHALNKGMDESRDQRIAEQRKKELQKFVYVQGKDSSTVESALNTANLVFRKNSTSITNFYEYLIFSDSEDKWEVFVNKAIQTPVLCLISRDRIPFVINIPLSPAA